MAPKLGVRLSSDRQYRFKRKQAVRGVFAKYVLRRTVARRVANVGFRPTVHGRTCLLEVHVFDFDQDIYGQAVEVALVAKLRDEKPFSSWMN